MLRKTWTLSFCVFYLAACVSNHGSITCEDLEITPPPPPETAPCENIPVNSWKPLGLENETISTIALHPNIEGLILVGTQKNFSLGKIGKLFRSLNCGQNWELVHEGGSFHSISFHPTNPSVIYATNERVLKSSNYGQTWEFNDDGINLNFETFAVDLEIDPSSSCVMYVGTSGFLGGGLYRTKDSGKTWKKLNGKGLDKGTLKNGVGHIAIDQHNSRYIFASIPSFLGSIVRSGNYGESWSETGLNNTGRIVHTLAIDPNNSQRIYTGLNRGGLFISHDRGENWSQTENQFIADTSNVVQVDIHPTNSNLYITISELGTGKLLLYNRENDRWSEIEPPASSNSFYLGQFKIARYPENTYQLLGYNGLYIKRE